MATKRPATKKRRAQAKAPTAVQIPPDIAAELQQLRVFRVAVATAFAAFGEDPQPKARRRHAKKGASSK